MFLDFEFRTSLGTSILPFKTSHANDERRNPINIGSWD